MEEVVRKRRMLIDMAEELAELRRESEELAARVLEHKARRRELRFLRKMYRKTEEQNRRYYERARAELGDYSTEELIALLEGCS
jgi:hypothetical protein